jgi:hypothetical protein
VSDRRHLQQDADPDQRLTAQPQRDRRDDPGTAVILDLHHRAGNRAVAALLAPHEAGGTRAAVQRAPEDQAPPAAPVNEGKKSATGTMTISELDLTTPITSFSQQVGRTNEPAGSQGEVVVTIAAENLDPRLTQAAATGRRFDTVAIAIGAQTLTLHGVVISSFSLGSDAASMGLNFTSIELGSGG